MQDTEKPGRTQHCDSGLALGCRAAAQREQSTAEHTEYLSKSGKMDANKEWSGRVYTEQWPPHGQAEPPLH